MKMVGAARSPARRAPPRMVSPHVQRRGAHAWAISGTDYFDQNADALLTGSTPPRLLVHAQMDATGLQYMRACRNFCSWAEVVKAPVYPPMALDRAVAVYMDILCYDDCIGPGEGKRLTSGLLALYPGLRLPES